MLYQLRCKLAQLLAIAVLIVGGTRHSRAAWITLQNDTNKVLVIQTSVECNGQVKRCKPVRLLPGESLKEFHSAPNVKLEIYPGQDNNKTIYSGSLSIKTENQRFGVTESKSIEVKPITAKER